VSDDDAASDPVIQAVVVAVIAALPPTIVAYVAWRQLALKSEQIHVLVNSNLTEVKANLAHALTEIAALKKVIKGKR
jgi:hypothetical protein